MYEDSVSSTMCHATRNRLCLDLNDPKKMLAKAESQSGVLTSRDLGMLELTSPELERIILDPSNDRFLGGRTAGFLVNDSVRQLQQQEQQGYGIITREQQESQRRFDSSVDQPRRQPILPEPALEAAFSSEEDSDTEASDHVTYTTLVPPQSKATTETGFTSESYFNNISKSVSLQAMMNSAVPSVTAGGVGFSSRMETLLPTAVHPGVSYLPIGTFHSVPSRLKEEPMQMVPCLDGSPLPPMSPINMEDQDRVRQERKRERNRLAARKCRTKKLEQIMHLEGVVKELKEQNRALGDTATALRAMMNKLQSQISLHISRGCPIMMLPTTTTTMLDSSSSPSSFAAH